MSQLRYSGYGARTLALAFLFMASVLAWAGSARATEISPLEQALRGLISDKDEVVEASIAKLAELSDPASIPALDALSDDRLRAAPDGALYIDDSAKHRLLDAVTGAVVTTEPPELTPIEM